MKNQKFKKAVVFRAYRIDKKTGKKVWARDYGKRAFVIYV
jgi:hypothetical protein